MESVAVNHSEAHHLAILKRDESNLARCYLDMAERIDALEAAIDRACDVFIEPYGEASPDKKVGDWRVEMLNAMRQLRALVPKSE